MPTEPTQQKDLSMSMPCFSVPLPCNTNNLQGSGRGDGGARPPPSHQRGGSGFGWGTLAFVAVLFFFLGHWLDFASAVGGRGGGGGAQSVGGAAGGFGKASPPIAMSDVKEAEGERYSSAAAAAGLSTHDNTGNPPPRDG